MAAWEDGTCDRKATYVTRFALSFLLALGLLSGCTPRADRELREQPAAGTSSNVQTIIDRLADSVRIVAVAESAFFRDAATLGDTARYPVWVRDFRVSDTATLVVLGVVQQPEVVTFGGGGTVMVVGDSAWVINFSR